MALLLAAQAAPSAVIDVPAPTARSPLLLYLANDLRVVCGDAKDVANQLICVSWLNGAAQSNGWFTPRDPSLTPAYCPTRRDFDLAAYRPLILARLDKHPADLARPLSLQAALTFSGAFRRESTVDGLHYFGAAFTA